MAKHKFDMNAIASRFEYVCIKKKRTSSISMNGNRPAQLHLDLQQVG